MTDKAIVPVQQHQIITTMDDAERAARAMAASKFFQDSADAAQALVKILAGQEIGFGAFASMTGISIIKGRPSIGANLMAAAVKKSGRYNYRVIEMTEKACEIAFFEGGQEVGRSRFTIEDGRKAGTQNLDKFPRNMLFARAISNGVKWYCPDVFNGSPVYTPEELGASVDEEGNVISTTFAEAPTMREAAEELGGKVAEPPAQKHNGQRAKLIERFRNVEAEAENSGVVFDVISDEELDNHEDDWIIARGKALRAAITAADV